MVPVTIGVEVAHTARVEFAIGEGSIHSCAVGVVAHIRGVDLVQLV